MSDNSSPSGAFEKVGQVVGGAVDAVADEFGQMTKAAATQVKPPKPQDPQEQKKEEQRIAEEKAEEQKIIQELHEIAEKLDQPTPEELEKRQLEERKQQEEELEKQRVEQEKQQEEPLVLPSSPQRGLNFNKPKQPIAVTRATTKRETHRGTSG